MQIFLENLDKLNSFLVHTYLYWAFLICAGFAACFNFYYMLREIIRGMPCLKGDREIEASWFAIKFIFIFFFICTSLPYLLLRCFITEEEFMSLNFGSIRSRFLIETFGPYLSNPDWQQKDVACVFWAIILLSILITAIFKILIYYKSKKNKDTKC